MRVLVAAPFDAAEVDGVIAALADRGAEAVCIRGDRFPGPVRASVRLDGARASRFDDVVLDDVDAAWVRLQDPGRLLSRRMEPAWREKATEAGTVLLADLLRRLSGFQLDPWDALRRADDKPRQLRLAAELGLVVPPTLLSNDPDDVRAFAREHGAVVTKLPTPGNLIVLHGQPEADAFKVYTTPLTEEDLQGLDGLTLCPMLVQPRLPVDHELRVTVVGGQVFTAAVRAEGLDWRRSVDAAWSPATLPGAVTEALLAMLDALELNFGCADFVVGPDGTHTFLEVNPSGAFGFFEDTLGFPIAAAIADLLTGRAAPRIG